jgi:hypothetical protein
MAKPCCRIAGDLRLVFVSCLQSEALKLAIYVLLFCFANGAMQLLACLFDLFLLIFVYRNIPQHVVSEYII